MLFWFYLLLFTGFFILISLYIPSAVYSVGLIQKFFKSKKLRNFRQNELEHEYFSVLEKIKLTSIFSFTFGFLLLFYFIDPQVFSFVLEYSISFHIGDMVKVFLMNSFLFSLNVYSILKKVYKKKEWTHFELDYSMIKTIIIAPLIEEIWYKFGYLFIYFVCNKDEIIQGSNDTSPGNH